VTYFVRVFFQYLLDPLCKRDRDRRVTYFVRVFFQYLLDPLCREIETDVWLILYAYFFSIYLIRCVER